MEKKKMQWIFFIGLMGVVLSIFALNAGLFKNQAESKTEGLDLGEKFRYYGSDKDINGYTSVYHILFDPIKDEPITMLEIGIGTMIPGVHSSMVGFAGEAYQPGGSLRAWRDYFKNGNIYGADVQPDTQFDHEPRIKTFICNSTDKAKVAECLEKLGNLKFDIILDDGSHSDYDQLKTLENLYPYVKDNGFYIIEDIYPGSSVSTQPDQVAQRSNGDPCFFVGVKNNICVIKKSHLNRTGDQYSY